MSANLAEQTLPQSAGSIGDHIASITGLSNRLLQDLSSALGRISEINRTTQVISMNARVESARSGLAGRAFGVIAEEMTRLGNEVASTTQQVGGQTGETGNELRRIIGTLHGDLRRTRFCELALNNIDLIDRNLYERSCDVRWWASDSALVDAARHPQPGELRFASRRMGQILDSYTVYYDLVLTDLQGKVIANGRPGQYKSDGAAMGGSEWFRSALATKDGTQYGFQSVHVSPLANGQRVLVYSCAVREEGRVDGRPLGVLGVVFNWDSLAQTVVQRTPLSAEEWRNSRACIVDGDGTVLADTAPDGGRKIAFEGMSQLFGQPRAAIEAKFDGRKRCIAHALSPGYETYRTGWHSLIVQDL